MNFLKKIKRTKFWEVIVTNFIYPLYNFFWTYILNFDAKILYWLWFYKKNREYFQLNDNDKIVIKDNIEFQNFSKIIFEKTSKYLNETKKIILSDDYKNSLKKTNYSRSKAPYHFSLYNFLSDQDKSFIVSFALSEKMISTAAKYMGVFPILTKVGISHNIPRENTPSRAAMLWHKDEFGFKSLDFFMTISDLDENNGPFFCIKDKIKAGVFKSFSNVRQTQGERGKVDFDTFNKKFGDYEVLDIKGNAGNSIFLDSFSTYHRGGECISKDRIMLRFCYQTKDAICDESFYQNSEKYIYAPLIKKNNNLNKFEKYVLFKKPSKIVRKISKILIQFYYLITFKF